MNRLLTTIAMLTLGSTAMAAGSYDGVYTGTRTTKPLRPSSLSCAPADNVAATITVVNNRFGVKVGIDSKDIEIAADGTISDSILWRTGGGSAVVNFKGKITNGDFQLDRGNEFCATHISLKKS